MKWEGGRQSDNVEDRRDGGGSGGGMGRGIAGGGIGVVLIAVVAMFLGVDPSMVLGLLGGGSPPAQVSRQAPAHKPPADDQAAKFVSVVLADTEDTWGALFKQGNAQYRVPKLVLFRGAVQSACGNAQAGDGTVLLPRRSESVYRFVFFR